MTFEQFKSEATKTPPASIRKGQYAFNTLETIRPDISHKIATTQYDPFYNDSRLDQFWEKVKSLWSIKCGGAC